MSGFEPAWFATSPSPPFGGNRSGCALPAIILNPIPQGNATFYRFVTAGTWESLWTYLIQLLNWRHG
jgi:hypothetical protein